MHQRIDNVGTKSNVDKQARSGVTHLGDIVNKFRVTCNQQTDAIETMRDELGATANIQIAEVNGESKVVTMKTIIFNELTTITKYVMTEIMRLKRNIDAQTSSRAPTTPIVRPSYQPHGQANATRG